jgi:hypothetical protein
VGQKRRETNKSLCKTPLFLVIPLRLGKRGLKWISYEFSFLEKLAVFFGEEFFVEKLFLGKSFGGKIFGKEFVTGKFSGGKVVCKKFKSMFFEGKNF